MLLEYSTLSLVTVFRWYQVQMSWIDLTLMLLLILIAYFLLNNLYRILMKWLIESITKSGMFYAFWLYFHYLSCIAFLKAQSFTSCYSFVTCWVDYSEKMKPRHFMSVISTRDLCLLNAEMTVLIIKSGSHEGKSTVLSTAS